MVDSALTLTAEETSYLVRILEDFLRQKQVEVHRTDSLTYRVEVEREVAIIESLLKKLRAG